jgi:hypothetical protein
MSIPPLINIDTLELNAETADERITIQNADHVRVIDSDGVIKASYQNRTSIPGKYGAHPLQARTMRDGACLKVEGSPYGHKYGQNVFTSPDLPVAAIGMLKTACKTLGIKPSPETKKRWIDGDIGIGRVDLAANFKFDSKHKLERALKQIALQLAASGESVRLVGTTVYVAPRNGTEYTIAIYAKAPQMRQNKNIKSHPQYSELLAECENVLRVEVRVRAAALRKHGLSKVRDWDENSAYKLFSQYMKKLKFLNITSGPTTDEELGELPARLRPVLVMHKSGIDLESVFGKRSMQRHTSDFKKRGIDLRCPNQVAGSTVALTKVLAPGRAYAAAPAWMLEAKLCPPPAESKPAASVKPKTASDADQDAVPITIRKRR